MTLPSTYPQLLRNGIKLIVLWEAANLQGATSYIVELGEIRQVEQQ
ncbi:hypothetical protein QT970_07985 [Microcoleus sp. herbarium8]